MQYKIIVDKQPSSNPSNEKKEYIIDIEELRVKGDVYDSLVITRDEDYVMRRLSLSEYGVLSVLEQEVKEPLENINIELFEGDNYVYLMDMQGNKFYAEYLIKNDFNDIYVNRNEMNSEITQTAQSIELSVNQKLESYSTTQEMNSTIEQTAQSITSSVNQTLTNYATSEELEDEVTELNSTINQTAQEINLEVSKKVGDDEIISKINQSAEEVQINANKISLEGKEIDLTGDNINISSTNFNVDKNGNLSCANANITGGKIEFSGSTYSFPKFITKGTGLAGFSGENIVYSDGIRVNVENDTLINLSIGTDGSGRAAGGLTLEYSGQTSMWTDLGPTSVRSISIQEYSSETIKKNIVKFNKNATNIIDNSDIYEYNLKLDKDTDKKMIGFIIGDNYKTPFEIISKDGNAIELYSAIGILWKAVQELSAKIEQLEKEAQNE